MIDRIADFFETVLFYAIISVMALVALSLITVVVVYCFGGFDNAIAVSDTQKMLSDNWGVGVESSYTKEGIEWTPFIFAVDERHYCVDESKQ